MANRRLLYLGFLIAAILGAVACQTRTTEAGHFPAEAAHSPNGELSTGKPSGILSQRLNGTGLRFLGMAGDDPPGFAKALHPQEFQFPQDYGSHPKFRTEWWYFTGNVFDAEGQHYGFDLTFFRYALAPGSPDSPSAWATNQVWMANFAVTDGKHGKFLTADRLSREAIGLAGATASPFKVWVEGWSVRADEAAFQLNASTEEASLELTLQPLTKPVANGDRGLSRKGAAPGNASYYYSVPRLRVSGTLSTKGPAVAVQGYGWLDREWSTSSLPDDVAGWDWFALQFDDGRELMFYRLRKKNGGSSPFSGGSLYTSNGQRVALSSDEVNLEPLQYWTSPTSGTRYPVAWRLRIPGREIDLTIEPYQSNQEFTLRVRYWEGAVKIKGSDSGQPVGGNGYLELAGY